MELDRAEVSNPISRALPALSSGRFYFRSNVGSRGQLKCVVVGKWINLLILYSYFITIVDGRPSLARELLKTSEIKPPKFPMWQTGEINGFGEIGFLCHQKSDGLYQIDTSGSFLVEVFTGFRNQKELAHFLK